MKTKRIRPHGLSDPRIISKDMSHLLSLCATLSFHITETSDKGINILAVTLLTLQEYEISWISTQIPGKLGEFHAKRMSRPISTL
jgi:hypothetical protein